MNMNQRFTVWQCRDWCCETKTHADRWWNVGTEPGKYTSVPSWHLAMSLVRSGSLRWSV